MSQSIKHPRELCTYVLPTFYAAHLKTGFHQEERGITLTISHHGNGLTFKTYLVLQIYFIEVYRPSLVLYLY